ncbi:general substrate transporter [Yarrowia lipolytica]|uniref:YALI0B06391p n=2 Tax=Yarrowia lipolytica TaxID=4952 RepID=Q6CFJ6_YARLI|nr:YALI0B06391p [Yarrowia lipolytica CLIB122]RDW24570.1 general substrate transporter [Yarrowia lipolytica]RDW34818.1 general substrate transporter [Yarrowia lipolytica]RDW38584.1 general substrate transporter [Yarrowia lipolytica]RDW42889.1 general substrate transporter [Yarrowia lipolytica]RDW49627.1 general substrate transporter [Yarrowia lipolytica]|eukprot:XP_500566.1 YALI0B06391p [Yarrowia lipolytica CLIB122]
MIGNAQINQVGALQHRFPKLHNPYLTAAVATMGGLLFGFDISSVSAFVDTKPYKEYFGYPTSIQQGGITASMAGGSFLSSLVAGWISDRLGRRFAIHFASFWWVVGAAIQSSAQNKGQLIAGRLISGLGIGLGSSVIPVYISELSPKKIRGRLVGLFQWAVTWGILIMFYISFGLSNIHGVAGFRVAWGLQIIPGLLMSLGCLFLEESPRWLAKQDNWDESVRVLRAIHQGGYGTEEDILLEIEEIREAVRIEHETKNLRFWHLFQKDSINRTMVGIWAQIWQQLTGMNVMMYYIVLIFTMAGYTGNANLVASSIQYVINMIMTIPALLFIDRVGRRPLLLFGSIVMMIWLFAVAGILAVYGTQIPGGLDGDAFTTIVIEPTHKPAQKGVIACSYLFVATFAPTWGPGIWLYCSELFPLKQRAVAAGVTASANWIFNFALALFVPSAFKNINWKTYIIFGVFCIVMTIHVFVLFPETKGKTLEEIDMMWAARVPAWRTANWVPDHVPGALPEDEKHSEEMVEAVESNEEEPKIASANVDAPPSQL